MSKQTWVETLVSSSEDSIALSNSTTLSTILPASAKFTFPNNYFDTIGRTIRVRAAGRISTVVTTPGNIQFFMRTAAGGGVNIASSGTMLLNIVAQTNASWWLEWLLTSRAIGTSTTFMHQGTFASRALLNAPAVGTTEGVGIRPFPDTAPAVGSGLDNSLAQEIQLNAQWSVANASNSIVTHLYTLEAMN